MLEEKVINEICEWIDTRIIKTSKPIISTGVPSGVHGFGFITVSKVEEDLDANNETFAEVLMKYLDKKNISNVDCYSHANITKETFSKIYSGKTKYPKRENVALLAISLKLDINEYHDFIEAASYASSRDKTDPLNIVEYFIERGEYDLLNIEEAVLKITGKYLASTYE